MWYCMRCRPCGVMQRICVLVELSSRLQACWMMVKIPVVWRRECSKFCVAMQMSSQNARTMEL